MSAWIHANPLMAVALALCAGVCGGILLMAIVASGQTVTMPPEIVEAEGVRINITLASRVRAAKHEQARQADHRDTVAAAVRDRFPDGSMDWMEQGRH